jgi:hypothetical protein
MDCSSEKTAMSFSLKMLSIVLIWIQSISSEAHQFTESLLQIHSGKAGIKAIWKVGLEELSSLVDLDLNKDSKITWSEFQSSEQAIRQTVEKLFQLKTDSGLLKGRCLKPGLENLEGKIYVSFEIQFSENPPIQALQLSPQFWEQLGSGHRVVVELVTEQGSLFQAWMSRGARKG